MSETTKSAVTSNEDQSTYRAVQRAVEYYPDLMARNGLNIAAVDAVTNIPKDTVDGMLAAVAVECQDSFSIWEEKEVTLAVKFAHVKPAEQFDKATGEVRKVARTTFVDHEGSIWTTNAPAVARAILTILLSPFGVREFNPPLKISFRRKSTLSGGECLTAAIAPESIKALVS